MNMSWVIWITIAVALVIFGVVLGHDIFVYVEEEKKIRERQVLDWYLEYDCKELKDQLSEFKESQKNYFMKSSSPILNKAIEIKCNEEKK